MKKKKPARFLETNPRAMEVYQDGKNITKQLERAAAKKRSS